MAKKKKIALPKLGLPNKKTGFIAVLIGILLALILSAFAADYGSWTTRLITIILVIGVIVGILNIFHKEGVLFLIAGLTITFMLSVLTGIAILPVWLVTILEGVIYLLAPATLIVGLKVLYALASK